MPLDLSVKRPTRTCERLLPNESQLRPISVTDGDAAQREQAALISPPALVQEKQVHELSVIGAPQLRLYSTGEPLGLWSPESFE